MVWHRVLPWEFTCSFVDLTPYIFSFSHGQLCTVLYLGHKNLNLYRENKTLTISKETVNALMQCALNTWNYIIRFSPAKIHMIFAAFWVLIRLVGPNNSGIKKIVPQDL